MELKGYTFLGLMNSATKEWKVGVTPLYLAAERGHVGVGRLLLEACSCTDSTTQEGCTPLIAAAGGLHAEFLHLLMEALWCFTVTFRS